MYLGIEIGGTKLQLAVGQGGGAPLDDVRRYDVEPEHGAQGILRQIETAAAKLIRAHHPRAIGVGFGGPVDVASGHVVKSHHVTGWDGFDLRTWCRERFDLPLTLGNDCDVAGLAEARFGAGQGGNPVFYVTVGTGIGGGLILDGEIYHGHGQADAELGHLRPGLDATEPAATLESLASGWGIAAAAASRMNGTNLTARDVVAAAAGGDAAACEVLNHTTTALGWAIAQTITLLSPEVIVIGGGVSLAGEPLFFAPLREAAERYVFPPLCGTYRIVPAALGEEVVLHGALALAAAATHNVPRNA